MARPGELPTSDPTAELTRSLAAAGYLADRPTALALWLALRLGRPLLLEGPAGVGKTDLARAAAEALGYRYERLQCYEGLDESRALFEWDYPKQILYTQIVRDALSRAVEGAASVAEAADRAAAEAGAFYTERFLIARPILRALRGERPAVLLIDEVDRADPEFEAFLLEVLGEFRVTIPELGTVRASHAPLVILTTNATRELTDALRRRCLFAYLDYPAPGRELAIVRAHVPDIDATLAAALVAFVGRVRALDLRKAPGVSEVLDWARALVALGARTLGDELARDTLGVLVKFEQDRQLVAARVADLAGGAAEALDGPPGLG